MLAAVPAALVASVLSAAAGWPGPLEATAEFLMEWTPVSVAEWLLRSLGTLARPAALLGALAIAMLICGLSGALAALPGTKVAGRLGGLALAGLWLTLVFVRVLTPGIAAPEFAFIAAVLALLAASLAPVPPIRGRAAFLARTGTILGGAAVLVTLFQVRPLLGALVQRRLFSFRRPAGWRVDGLTDLVTPQEHFYRMDRVLDVPQIGPPGWRLAVDGLVERPLILDYGTLIGHPRLDHYVTMECVDNSVGGPLISTALFTGVSVTDLLDRVGARGTAVVFHSADGYAESVPRRVLEEHGAIVAYAMNGEVLARAHGYPARLVLPGVYGFKSVKWLQRIQVVPQAEAGSWHSHGWAELPIIHTTCRIDVARRQGRSVLLAGIAFAGHRGVSAIEVRVNGGPWRRASIGRRLSRDTWVQWGVRLAGPPNALVEVRAIDGQGHIQTRRVHGAYPAGATGWASRTV